MKIDAKTYRELLSRSEKEGKSILQILYSENKDIKPEQQQKSNVPCLENLQGRQKNKHPESDLQRECVEWFKTTYPTYSLLLFHPNNEPFFGGKGKSMAKQKYDGYIAQQMGVTKGVADLILLCPSYDGKYHGLCIEMKSPKGVQRDSQKEWQRAVESTGYRYELARDFITFRRIIREHLHIE